MNIWFRQQTDRPIITLLNVFLKNNHLLTIPFLSLSRSESNFGWGDGAEDPEDGVVVEESKVNEVLAEIDSSFSDGMRNSVMFSIITGSDVYSVLQSRDSTIN